MVEGMKMDPTSGLDEVLTLPVGLKGRGDLMN